MQYVPCVLYIISSMLRSFNVKTSMRLLVLVEMWYVETLETPHNSYNILYYMGSMTEANTTIRLDGVCGWLLRDGDVEDAGEMIKIGVRGRWWRVH